MISDFHFLSPEWFLALLPLATILWGIRRRGDGAGAWQRVVDPGLLPHLLVPGGGAERWLPLGLLAFGWRAGVLALTNPTFERLPVSAYRGELSRVVVLDLSRSMETPDLEPSRLAHARYKVADILERSRDGEVGLIAYAGDAFVVSPLTDDADTILAMLDAVTPEIMPVQGRRSNTAKSRNRPASPIRVTRPMPSPLSKRRVAVRTPSPRTKPIPPTPSTHRRPSEPPPTTETRRQSTWTGSREKNPSRRPTSPAPRSARRDRPPTSGSGAFRTTRPRCCAGSSSTNTGPVAFNKVR